jgi:hypothetical protein
MSHYKEHLIWWDDENKIVRLIGVGLADEPSARWILAETERIGAEKGAGVDWLADLREITKTTSKARKILSISSGHPSIRKFALIGASTFLKTVANFVFAASGQKNARHFESESEALMWLLEDRDA